MTLIRDPERETVQFKGDPKDTFLADVRKRVEDYFIRTKSSKTANWIIYLKGSILILTCLLLYLSLLNGWLPQVPRMLLWIAMGINQALIAVNIGHDALHGSYTNSPLANKILGFLAYDCIGLSSYIWKQTHNREHHTFTNIAGKDPDINKPGLLRLSSHDPYYPIHKYQHWYIWALYSLVGLNWILYSDYVNFWAKRKEAPKAEIGYFIFFKSFYMFWMIIAPIIFSPMPWWEVIIGYVLLQFAGGLTVAIIFQLAHLVENVDFPLPDENGIIHDAWGAHEMKTTSNFATDSAFVTHLVGGLNFQVEHHLLPKISHCHYQKLSKIVRDAAKEHHLPYHEQPTMLAAIASHTRYLRKLGSGQ